MTWCGNPDSGNMSDQSSSASISDVIEKEAEVRSSQSDRCVPVSELQRKLICFHEPFEMGGWRTNKWRHSVCQNLSCLFCQWTCLVVDEERRASCAFWNNDKQRSRNKAGHIARGVQTVRYGNKHIALWCGVLYQPSSREIASPTSMFLELKRHPPVKMMKTFLLRDDVNACQVLLLLVTSWCF